VPRVGAEGAPALVTRSGSFREPGSFLLRPTRQTPLPFSVATTEQISRIAIAAGYANSAVGTATYTYTSGFPVITIKGRVTAKGQVLVN
jgi:hypothetical protein